jgi:methionyl-tRNA formyltransferase
VSDPEVIERLRRLRSDVVLMAGFDQILGPPVLAALGPVLNVHPSLLPSYRGPAPHFWMVHNGETEGGVSVHLVDTGIDSGPLLAQERFVIEPWTTGGELYERASRAGGALAIRVLRELRAGASGPATQDGESSYFGPVAPEHLAVAFAEPLQAAYNRARAAEPGHGSWVRVPHEVARGERASGAAALVAREDVTTLRLHRPAAFPGARIGPPGTVRREGAGAVVQCVDGALLFATAMGV